MSIGAKTSLRVEALAEIFDFVAGLVQRVPKKPNEMKADLQNSTARLIKNNLVPRFMEADYFRYRSDCWGWVCDAILRLQKLSHLRSGWPVGRVVSRYVLITCKFYKIYAVRLWNLEGSATGIHIINDYFTTPGLYPFDYDGFAIFAQGDCSWESPFAIFCKRWVKYRSDPSTHFVRSGWPIGRIVARYMLIICKFYRIYAVRLWNLEGSATSMNSS